MRHYWFGIIFLFIGCATSKINKTSTELQKTFERKNTYLIDHNVEGLKSILHQEIDYCHSNCWSEDVHSILKGQGQNSEHSLDYKNIKVSEITTKIVSNCGIIRGKAEFDIHYNGNDIKLNLCFVETYLYEKKQWRLLTRQASKVPQ